MVTETHPKGAYLILAMKAQGFFTGHYYLLGQSDQIDGNFFYLSKPVRIFEIMDNKFSLAQSYVADDLTSNGDEVVIPRSSVKHYRRLNPEDTLDREMIKKAEGEFQKLRLKKSGLVAPKESHLRVTT